MDIFEALAEPTRRDILEMLADRGQLAASDIYGHFPVSHPAISQHLKVLRDTHLVEVEKKAQQRLYQLNTAKFSEVETWFEQMKKLWNQRFDALDTVLELEKTKS